MICRERRASYCTEVHDLSTGLWWEVCIVRVYLTGRHDYLSPLYTKPPMSPRGDTFTTSPKINISQISWPKIPWTWVCELSFPHANARETPRPQRGCWIPSEKLLDIPSCGWNWAGDLQNLTVLYGMCGERVLVVCYTYVMCRHTCGQCASVMVNLCCGPDWIWDHLGVIPSHVYVVVSRNV